MIPATQRHRDAEWIYAQLVAVVGPRQAAAMERRRQIGMLCAIADVKLAAQRRAERA